MHARTTLLRRLLLALTMSLGFASAASAAAIEVYKDPNCGCCSAWIEHLKANGFEPVVHNVPLSELNRLKQTHGLTRELASCHTAVAEGYVVEGHVPADDIKRLLSERPQLTGLAVPGMPMGSPGMEGPYRQPYAVVGFTEAGETTVFARH